MAPLFGADARGRKHGDISDSRQCSLRDGCGLGVTLEVERVRGAWRVILASLRYRWVRALWKRGGFPRTSAWAARLSEIVQVCARSVRDAVGVANLGCGPGPAGNVDRRCPRPLFDARGQLRRTCVCVACGLPEGCFQEVLPRFEHVSRRVLLGGGPELVFGALPMGSRRPQRLLERLWRVSQEPQRLWKALGICNISCSQPCFALHLCL